MTTWMRPEDLVGQVFGGKYQLTQLLGTGGMGAVYEAVHLQLDKRVAIKVLSPTLAVDLRQRQRFLNEARAAAKIPSKHVVEIHDFGEEPSAFFVMERLNGCDLGDRIRERGSLTWAQAKPLALDICQGLAAAHERGIVHRDIKPSNIFLARQEDGTECVKLLDFGIAKMQPVGGEKGLTNTHDVLGTATYMSPEQAQGDPIDLRTDIYALGIVLFELLSGTVPFEGNSAFRVMSRHVSEPPPPLRLVQPAAPEALEVAILGCMAKDPDHRFGSVASLVEALTVISTTSSAAPAHTAVLEGGRPGVSVPPTLQLPAETGSPTQPPHIKKQTESISAPPQDAAEQARENPAPPTAPGGDATDPSRVAYTITALDRPNVGRRIGLLAAGAIVTGLLGAGVAMVLIGDKGAGESDLVTAGEAARDEKPVPRQFAPVETPPQAPTLLDVDVATDDPAPPVETPETNELPGESLEPGPATEPKEPRRGQSKKRRPKTKPPKPRREPLESDDTGTDRQVPSTDSTQLGKLRKRIRAICGAEVEGAIANFLIAENGRTETVRIRGAGTKATCAKTSIQNHTFARRSAPTQAKLKL